MSEEEASYTKCTRQDVTYCCMREEGEESVGREGKGIILAN